MTGGNRPVRRTLRLAAAFGAIASVLIGGGVDAVSASTRSAEQRPGRSRVLPTIELVAAEHAFTAPVRAVGGVVRIELDNEGRRVHTVQLVRVDPGRGSEDVAQLLRGIEAGGDPGTPEWLHETGVHFSPVGPGREFAVVAELEPGTYVAYCEMQTVDGTHSSSGMVAEVELIGTSGLSLPATDATLVVDDHGFTLPSLAQGRQLVTLRNDGDLPHRFEFGRFRGDATLEELASFLSDGQVGELPSDWAGGLVDLPPGTSVITDVSFDAGEWTVVDASDAGLLTGTLTVRGAPPYGPMR